MICFIEKYYYQKNRTCIYMKLPLKVLQTKHETSTQTKKGKKRSENCCFYDFTLGNDEEFVIQRHTSLKQNHAIHTNPPY